MNSLNRFVLYGLRHLTFAGLFVLAPAVWSLEVGSPAPELSLPGLKEAVNLAQSKGKVVYLDFWASWCGPCKLSFPFMNELQAKYREQGLEVIAVNLDTKRADADQFLAQVPAQFTVAFDTGSTQAKRFDIRGMPTSYIIGRDGSVVAVHAGFKDADRKTLDARVSQALSAK
jgi:cytochrome c biogenesis protein CcmG, thiol:disulfide interchange protein DsbE